MNKVAINQKTSHFYSGRLFSIQIAPTAPEKLGDEIRAVLSDKKRPGAPAVFTPDQIMRIIDLACTSPNDFGYVPGTKAGKVHPLFLRMK